MTLPKKYKPQDSEKQWQELWEKQKTYHWDKDSDAETFTVDTPPPTVSGSLHIGHVFSYTQTDIIARFQRMLGKNIFYPIGWDDNGLPTERRVQNYFGIKCNPQVADDPNWKPNYDYNPKKDKILEVSRNNFIAACKELTEIDEKVYEQMWRRLGLSVDWRQAYATIDDHCRKTSQLSFLDLAEKGHTYSVKAPTMWDVDFQSAIAQAELEDRDRPGAYHDLRFAVEGGGEFTISTTRPELLPACIAVVAHPDDERYQPLFGKKAITPLFSAPVEIRASEHAEPDKGTGIMMVCTFGDVADVDWWKQSGLPIKQIISRAGKIIEQDYGAEPFTSTNPELAQKNYQELAGLYLNQAKRRIVELLQEAGSFPNDDKPAMIGEAKQITHPVKFYEKGDRPLEFIPTRQWFVKTLNHKEDLIKQGEKINWHPEHMRVRYDNWVNGLNQDWCISRQRYFGVPFPVWYPLDENKEVNYDEPIFAKAEDLPVDPATSCPDGYTAEQRGEAGGFIADPDVMDTWATSALTPQLSSHWGLDEERHQKLFPANIRPQAHEIIRTWAFYTIVKAWLHHQEIPWKDIIISGWVLDPDRKKMSKSKGNIVTPESLFDDYSADAIRYWSGRARLGTDTAVDHGIFKTGHKLVTKIFNASKFVLMQFERIDKNINDLNPENITEQLDLALIDKVRMTITKATVALEQFNYAEALKVSEELFWDYCDNYLELVKVRSYQDEDSPQRESALTALGLSLKAILRLFAPFTPYVTEEVWQASFAADTASIHKESWPNLDEFQSVNQPEFKEAYDAATEVIGKIRGFKTGAQKSLKWEIETLEITTSAEMQSALNSVLDDVLKAGNVVKTGLSFNQGDVADGVTDLKIKLNENWSAS